MEAKYEVIGKRLKQVRGQRNQDEFAALLGVSKNAYLNYEKGYRMPPGEVLTRAAHIGHTSVDWLLSGEEKETKKKGVFVAEDSAEYDILQAVRTMPKSRWGAVRGIIRALAEEEGEKGPKKG